MFVLSQVILQSQVKASLAISDAWLDLQDGFAHAGKGDGRPVSKFFPLIVSSKSRAGILFSICVVDAPAKGRPIFLVEVFTHSFCVLSYVSLHIDNFTTYQ